MDRKAPRPQVTKELLIHDSVRRLESKYRQEFASGLLSARTGLPSCWLKPEQLVFVELEAAATVDAEIQGPAHELADRVLQLCDLVYALIDDFSRKHITVSDQKQRASLRRGRGTSVVCKVLFGRYRTWPPTDPAKIGKRVRAEIDKALREAIQPSRDGTSTNGGEPAAADSNWSTQNYPARDYHKVRATDDPKKMWRYILLHLAEASVTTMTGLITAVTLAVVYFGLFLVLHHFVPELTTREDMIVAGAAITSALGGSGVMLAGQAIRARLDRGSGRAGPRAGSRPNDAAE